MLEKEEEKQLLYFIISIFWRSTFTWDKVECCNFNNEIIEEMKSFLKEEIVILRTFKIYVEVMTEEFWGVIFPFKAPRENSIEEYTFVIMDYMFTLVPEKSFLFEQTPKDIQVIYGIDKKRESAIYKAFKRIHAESTKKGGENHDITW
ncbi:hypothetical protein Xsto_03004 [Xenorhabdus stockiae]|uniref:Uncharacterized protein n=1 Tax=Xenorhabdus stockiae TaxID=351614 RepID=A0A2D0KM52_9GAMM|nr:hypothetical protein [Xenorhabdus stockiae]PHM64468.1 hypothetical protein Xsto_03004 [Xenorhabdus stockiae]